MSAAKGTKQDRIYLRLKHSAKKVLERAASFEGKTASNFILTSALAPAEKTVHEHDVMSLNARDAETFFKALTKPVRFNKKLARISHRPSPTHADLLAVSGRTPSGRLDVVSATPSPSSGPCPRHSVISTPSRRTAERYAG